MTPEEIRQDGIDSYGSAPVTTDDHSHFKQLNFMLSEIAAQLAELNQNIKLLAPSDIEIQHRAVELDIAEIDQIKAQRAAHEALVNAPVSDPENFTRCDWCAKEVPRPDGCAIGKTITCVDCVPF